MHPILLLLANNNVVVLMGMRRDGPVQYALPSFQPERAAASRVPRLGKSSASGAAIRQALQTPSVERVRNETVPEPRQ